MKENVVKDKSFAFAVKIVALSRKLSIENNEYVLSRQLLKSGTSIGANVREAEHAESKADFIHKLQIALKEANETEYWLDLLKETGFIDEQIYVQFQNDIKELLKLLTSIINTSKKK